MKIRGDYPTLLNGVSQQPPHVMLPGQHVDQVNMHSDPVYGLTRRWGTVRKAVTAGANPPATGAALPAIPTRCWDWRVGGKEYAVLYGPYANTPATGVKVYDKDAGAFVPVHYNPADTALIAALAAGPMTSVTAVGEYLVMTGPHMRSVAGAVAVPEWSATNALGAVWVRGGAYNRTYTLRMKNVEGVTVTATYTTPKSSFDKVLDISGIPAWVADPATGTDTSRESIVPVSNSGTAPYLYHRLSKGALHNNTHALTVFDRNGISIAQVTTTTPAPGTVGHVPGSDYLVLPVGSTSAQGWYVVYDHKKAVANPGYTAAVAAVQAEYNKALSDYILASAAAITPAAIASALVDAAGAAPPHTGTPIALVADGEHIKVTGAVDIVAEDGGDNTLIEAVDNTVAAITDLTKKFWVNSRVRVKPADSDSVFYMRAIGSGPSGTFADVTWEECAAKEYIIHVGVLFGKIHDGALRIASQGALLQYFGIMDAPAWGITLSGDEDTNPLPYFVGREISYLGVFQDRLLIGCNGVLSASKVGDYFTFSRASVLTAIAADPVEISSQSSEDDRITGGAFFDRNLVLFGKRQYMLDGGTPLSLTSALLPVLSSHAGANDIDPVSAGTSIYYAKQSAGGASVHQMQPGAYEGSADSFPISAHLRTYFGNSPQEITACHDPSLIVLRTSTANTLYILRYLDGPRGERQQQAWSRWVYPSTAGYLVSCSQHGDTLILFMLKDLGPAAALIALEQPLSSGRSSLPYMDDMVPASAGVNVGMTHAAYDSTTRQYVGGTIAERDTLIGLYGTSGLWYGVQYPSSVTLNRPFVYEAEKASLSGKLTVSRVYAKFTESGGAWADILDVTDGSVLDVEDLPAAHSSLTTIGEQPLTSEEADILLAHDADDYRLTLRAKEWLPLAITGLRWEGQYFNRTQRT